MYSPSSFCLFSYFFLLECQPGVFLSNQNHHLFFIGEFLNRKVVMVPVLWHTWLLLLGYQSTCISYNIKWSLYICNKLVLYKRKSSKSIFLKSSMKDLICSSVDLYETWTVDFLFTHDFLKLDISSVTRHGYQIPFPLGSSVCLTGAYRQLVQFRSSMLLHVRVEQMFCFSWGNLLLRMKLMCFCKINLEFISAHAGIIMYG